MYKRIRKYLNLIAAFLFGMATIVVYKHSHNPDFENEVKSFEKHFLAEEQKLDFELDRALEIVQSKSVEDLWLDEGQNQGIEIHVYRNDSLKYWNSNEIPILRYADIHFPSEGINHLQNGWYFTHIRKFEKVIVAASFLIKSEYSYENDDLVNDFAGTFNWKTNTGISIDSSEGYQIHDRKGEYRFSLIGNDQAVVTASDSLLILLLLLGTIYFFVIGLNVFRQVNPWLNWGIPILILLLRGISIKYSWSVALTDNFSFSPSLYGGNQFVQNIADYLINIMLLAFCLHWLTELVGLLAKQKSRSNYFVLILFSVLPFWKLITIVIEDLVENSQIPISLNEVFTLDIYSLIVLLGWGMLLFFYYLYLREIIGQLITDKQNPTGGIFFIFIYGFLYIIWNAFSSDGTLVEGIFPLISMLSVFFLSFRKRDRNPLGSGLIQLFLFSLFLSLILGIHNQHREQRDRELYADQLAFDKDVEAEWEYSKLNKAFEKDKILPKIISGEVSVSRSDFQEIMERRFFNGFWERYDIDFDLCKTNGVSIFNGGTSNARFVRLNLLIDHNGEASPLDTSIIYLNNYSSSYNYIIRQTIHSGDTSEAILIATLRTKKIPEEIGFPRLLISNDANVLQPLENYSIAKYNNGKLISQHGEFGFPSNLRVYGSGLKNRSFFRADGYEHYFLRRNNADEILLSRKQRSIYDQLTAFSYLFSLYGLILLPVLFRSRKRKFREVMSLAMRIQLMLIFIVFIALLGFGFGSGFFIRSQYNDYTKQVISEKLSSVDMEVQNRIGELGHLSTAENREELQQLLQKFALTFNTDINMYDEDGYLLATSKPKLFNMGIVSEQINPEAYKNLTLYAKSKYVHQESIGKLNYASAYRPFYNRGGKRLAYINLQHFGKQSELESQIQGLLVAIINIFILLLALTVLLALMVSNWLTIPLRKLQDSLTSIRFGKHNEPIAYGGDDEIGSLVKAYNQKLEELAFTAEQLAQSERESAWREMAKQVAHEIKNPLTPMKLSVQQLLRTYDPNDPNSKSKLERVAQSIVEQIDALTAIANEFSNFAKLPQLKSQKVNLVDLIQNVLTLFEAEYSCSFIFRTELERAEIMGDKDQLMRVLNNLVKNAVQAIPGDRLGEISVELVKEGGYYVLSVKDNGVGISREERKNLFIPYFTTKSTGTGLGLAMVKQIIENHKGSIQVRSEKGEGATFIIELPIV